MKRRSNCSSPMLLKGNTGDFLLTVIYSTIYSISCLLYSTVYCTVLFIVYPIYGTVNIRLNR